MPLSNTLRIAIPFLLALVLLRCSIAVGGERITPGTQLSFHGTFVKVTKDETPTDPEKSFDLTILVASDNENGAELLWLLDESGRGGWSWIDRAGRWSLDAAGKGTTGVGPALLYDRGDGTSVIPFESPLLISPEAPAAGVTWTSGTLKHEFLGKEPLTDAKADVTPKQEAWKVAASSGYGHKRHQWIDDSGLVVRLSERVFMGQGEEYELTWQLAAVETLAPEAFQARSAEFSALLDLVATLKRPARTEVTELKDGELAALAEGLPPTEKAIAAGPLLKLVAAAKSDLALQTDRANDVADLAAKFEGKQSPRFALDGLAGQKLSDGDLKGQVTVLHFWEYRDEPLREPYGQIGYLDFLYDKRKSDGVKVYGIAVDARLSDEAKRGAAVRSAAKLVSFMNLSYPLLLDSGGLLKEFGDPRLLGAQLPLFVVIDAEGKIAHYFVGCYEVDRDAGLKQLNDVLTAALKKRS